MPLTCLNPMFIFFIFQVKYKKTFFAYSADFVPFLKGFLAYGVFVKNIGAITETETLVLRN